MRTIEKTVYTFLELSEDAKERALTWYQEGMEFDSEFDIDDFVTIMEKFGFRFSTMKGRNEKPEIYFSGFCSQGDGASFFGTWRYKKGWKKDILAYCPLESEYIRIMDEISKIAKKNLYRYDYTIGQNHYCHYSHSGTMVSQSNDYNQADDDNIIELFRELANTFYYKLEEEYDYQNSIEILTESIELNGYEFDEFGNIA